MADHPSWCADGPAERTAARLVTLAAAVQRCEDLAEAAGLVVDHAEATWPGVRVGVVLGRGRTMALAAGHADLTTTVEGQVRAGEGPDVDVLAHDSDIDLVVVHDVAQDERWPQWAAAAAKKEVRSAVVARLTGPAAPVGTLGLHATEPGRFTPADEHLARVVAQQLGLALAAVEERVNLWRAVEARWLVGQAQGILMERFAMDADKAFAVLRRYSQDRNIKLRTLAERLVQTRKMPD